MRNNSFAERKAELGRGGQRRIFFAVFVVVAAAALASGRSTVTQTTAAPWRFAVSGDSRNCGDVVMPAIAASALQRKAVFYWHLGDFRAIYNFDEDMQHEPEHRSKPMTISQYENLAWQDFLENQIAPFGSLPVFLGIGNHETIPPKTREEYLAQFGDWLATPVLREQRLRDDPNDHRLKIYFHWTDRGLDFINLDNASYDQFDAAQLSWFERVLTRDETDPAITTVVVGMHCALPDSISASHSMNESPVGTESGRTVYQALLKARDQFHKRVYVLASHSHYFMDGIFNTEYWHTRGGVLPGWIVGTAGAVRYSLPPDAKDARLAETNVYGYLLGTVSASGEIQFQFQPIREADIPSAVTNHFQPEFVHWCFAENREAPRN